MAIKANKDIIRGIGFVTVYWAYLEDKMADLIRNINNSIPLPKKIENKGLTQKAKCLKDALTGLFENATYKLKDQDHNQVVTVLDKVIEAAKKRNMVIHAVHISDKGTVIRKDRLKNLSEKVTPSDMYEFANQVIKLKGDVFGLKFPTGRLINSILKDEKKPHAGWGN